MQPHCYSLHEHPTMDIYVQASENALERFSPNPYRYLVNSYGTEYLDRIYRSLFFKIPPNTLDDFKSVEVFGIERLR